MDKPTLRRLLECPVCFRLPRPSSGVRVYLCSEGHSLCSRCFERLPRRECPQGRCAFAKPDPTRNRTAEAMAEEADFDAPCRNGDDGCDFEGKKDSLARHEAKCDKGRVPCVEGGSCKARLTPTGMTEHLRTYHQQVVFLDGSDAGGSTSTQKWLLKRKQHLVKSSCCWNTVVWNVQGQQVAIRFLKRDDIWYTFVVVFGDDAAAAKIKCEVQIPGTDYFYPGKVHPVRERTEDIIRESSCLMLPNDIVKDLVSSTGISESSLKSGFDGHLTVSYTVLPANNKAKKRRSSAAVNNNNNVGVRGANRR